MIDDVWKYKTRGMSDPTTKPKVYFCSHTCDFNKYFNVISDEILKFQNCSVWYMEPMSLNSDIMFGLSQMLLFVVPVTYRFLTDDKDPSIEIFQYALSQNVPILPIMVEIGIEFFYAARFGKIQYLNKMDTDPTAIPYEMKLSQYLSQVLISDETVGKIRDAFYAYIFLSYRKKDREYAQKLMKKIHGNDSYERVAIWYDEFLVPGEWFDEEIRTVLEKSDLFSMVITPNIVNEENYVMNVEYPMALELNKLVFPVEMVPIDKALLQNRYINMPESIDFQDDSGLQSALRRLLPITENKSEQDENRGFLIGLAYLSGIDVERDSERGISLIERAAGAGVEAAIRKMVDIYSKGIAVKRDSEKAYDWERKLVSKYKVIADESGKAKDMMVFLRELMDFIRLADECEDALLGLSLCDEAYETVTKIMCGKGKGIGKIFSAMRIYKRNPELLDEAFDRLLKICRIALNFSCNIDMRENLEKWLDRVTFLAKVYGKFFDDQTNIRELFAIYDNVVDIAIKSEKYGEARTYVEKMSDILPNLLDSEDPMDFKYCQALLYQKEADISRVAGDSMQSYADLSKCIEMLSEISKECPEDIMNIVRLISAQNKIGALYLRNGDINGAEKWLHTSEKALDNLKSDGYYMESNAAFAQTIVLHGNIEFSKNDIEKALETYNAAYIVYTNITEALKENISSQNVRDFCELMLQIGRCYEHLGRFSEAEKYYVESAQTASSVFTLSKSVFDARFMADAYELLWNNAISIGDCVSEKEWYEKLLLLLTELEKVGYSESDRIKSDDLKNIRKKLKEEGKIGTIDYNAPASLLTFIFNNSIEYDEKARLYIEKEIASLLEKYWQVFNWRMDDKTTLAFSTLELALTRRGKYAQAVEEELTGVKLRYSEIVLRYLLKNHNAFSKYDEIATLINNFCGYFIIDGSKHMIGGKKQGMNDFWNFWSAEPFWAMPMQRIKHPELWKAIHYWVMTTRHKYM